MGSGVRERGVGSGAQGTWRWGAGCGMEGFLGTHKEHKINTNCAVS